MSRYLIGMWRKIEDASSYLSEAVRPDGAEPSTAKESRPMYIFFSLGRVLGIGRRITVGSSSFLDSLANFLEALLGWSDVMLM